MLTVLDNFASSNSSYLHVLVFERKRKLLKKTHTDLMRSMKTLRRKNQVSSWESNPKTSCCKVTALYMKQKPKFGF